MAFTNVRTGPGAIGWVTYADWTFTQGAAADSIVLSGGRLHEYHLHSEDTTGAILPWNPRVSVSVSGATQTVTVYAQEGVTTGRAAFHHS